MRPRDAYEDDRRDDDLPELPLPRPDASAGQPPLHGPIAPPRLGGGASFTSAGAGGADEQCASPGRGAGPISSEATWDIAARLTAGMLANPARQQASVKDAMGLFDQFLHEMHAYARIVPDMDLDGAGARRRREHGDYFHAASSATRPVAPIARPEQPKPLPGYTALPPEGRQST